MSHAIMRRTLIHRINVGEVGNNDRLSECKESVNNKTNERKNEKFREQRFGILITGNW